MFHSTHSLVPTQANEDETLSAQNESALDLLPSSDNASDIYSAFARFLRVDVANGDATQDTIKAYFREVTNWVDWCQTNGIAPENARRQHIEAFREQMKQRGLSVATRAHKLSIIRRFYESAVKEGLRTGGTEVLVVAGATKEYLIPFAEKICTEVDVESKLIKVDVPDGLLEF